MHISIKAKLFDGLKAAGENVRIDLYPKYMEIDFPESGRNIKKISSSKISVFEKFSESFVLELDRKKHGLHGKLIVSEPDSMNTMESFLNKGRNLTFIAMLKDPEDHHLFKIISYTLPLIAIALILFFLGVFNFYRILPTYVDEGLGTLAYNQFMAGFDKCEDETLNLTLTDMAQRLAPEDYPYEIDVSIVKSEMVNAISLPGGKIIFFSGLISGSESPDEVAGVMAHELAHIYRRHGLQQVIRVSGITLVAAMVTGGTFEDLETFETMAEVGSMLILLKYSRSFEQEADEMAYEFLKNAKMNPDGLISFFQRLYQSSISDEIMNEDQNTDDSAILSFDTEKKKIDFNTEKLFDNIQEWASTHPPDEKRIESLKKLSGKNKYKTRPIFGRKWETVRNNCD
ncbi:MAG: M48 family metallopeptidase [Spirochaetia bacterium]|nr:M48 family metallopeptidase [Spirochaetia bacterium]